MEANGDTLLIRGDGIDRAGNGGHRQCRLQGNARQSHASVKKKFSRRRILKRRVRFPLPSDCTVRGLSLHQERRNRLECHIGEHLDELQSVLRTQGERQQNAHPAGGNHSQCTKTPHPPAFNGHACLAWLLGFQRCRTSFDVPQHLARRGLKS